MGSINTKRIEEAGTTALKTALLRCSYVDSYIDSNDKTPSWDGTIFVYNSDNHKKENWLGRIPVQIKATSNRIISHQASFSCSAADLKNYYNDGGCMFFLVSVDPTISWYKIYYASLLTFDLSKCLKSAGKQKKYTIKLKSFPENDETEMAHIFMDFVKNQPKQMSFIGKDILSVDALEKSGVEIEQFCFETSGPGIPNGNIESFITTHEFYLYAKLKGLDIDVPIDKVSRPVVEKAIQGTVVVNGVKHFDSYRVVYENGNASFHIGQGIWLIPPDEDGKSTIRFKPQGTLSNIIKDASLFVDIIDQRSITMNGVELPFHKLKCDNPDKYRSNLAYYREVKAMLDALGVTEELQCDNLTPNDENNLRNFVKAILYGKKIGFPKHNESVIFGPFKIANLSIHIWACKHEDGLYKVDSFFNDYPVALFVKNDFDKKHPIKASHYLLLKSDDFVDCSNMDYDKIYSGLISKPYSPQMMEQAVLLLLEILKGFDSQKQKETRLLDFAEKVCNWIAETDPEANPDICLLNKLQIAKRKRDLNIDELLKVAALTRNNKPTNIQCGAFLLLGDTQNAQACFDSMEPDVQREFIEYPICSFGSLQIAETI